MTPIISVIVPCHNVEIYIDTCINSIINQSFTEIEIICLDDHSSDQTLNKLRKWQKKDNRIIVYSLIHLTGAATARNFGIKIAKGKYITFIDSDDFVVLNFLEDFYQISKNTNIPIVSGIHKAIPSNEWNEMELLFSKKESACIANFNQDPSYILKFPPHITGKLYKKEAITSQFLANYIWEDLPFFMETSFQNAITYYVNPFSSNYYYFYRQNENGVTLSLSNPSSKNLDIIHVMQYILKQLHYYYKLNDAYKKNIDAFIANFLFQNLKIIFFSVQLSIEEQKEFTYLLKRIYQYYFPNFIQQISQELAKKYQMFYQFINESSSKKITDIKQEEKNFLKKARQRKKKQNFFF